MAVEKVTAAQWEARIRTSLLNRTKKYDTSYGPVKDLFLFAPSQIFEDVNNNRLRPVSLLQSLKNSTEFSEDDLNDVVFNEGILRPEGSRATTTLTYRRFRPFLSGEAGTIPRGSPVGTSIDQSSGFAVTFVTTETRDKTSAVPMVDSDTSQIVYEVSVPAICLSVGAVGRVGPDALTHQFRPNPAYDEVTNKTSSSEGRDTFTNEELIDLYLLAVGSRQLSVPAGSEFYTQVAFPNVLDVHEVFGADPLLTRAGTDAGAVDAFIKGEELITQADENIPFIGIGQTLRVAFPPLVRVDLVEDGGTELIEGTDYEVVFDATGVGGSTRARDGIRLLPSTNTSTIDPGDPITVSYTYNQLIRTLQANLDDPRVNVEGRDLLYRAGDRVDVYLTATVKVLGDFSPTTIKTLVRDRIVEFIGGLGLGDDLEIFDLNAAVAEISGVDNLIITKLTRSETAIGAADILIEPNAYAAIELNNLVLI